MAIDLLDPGEILYEERVGVQPHATVIIEDEQSIEICEANDGERCFAFDKLELRLGMV